MAASPSEFRGLWHALSNRARDTPEKVTAIDERNRTLTFRQLHQQAEAVGAALHERGIREGDVVSWVLPTWLEAMVLTCALARLGAVQNPILPIYGTSDIRYMVAQAGSKLLVVPDVWRASDFRAMAEDVSNTVGAGLEVLVLDGQRLPRGEPTSLPPEPPETHDEDASVLWVFYSSGTTADPKGARHTDHTIKWAAIGMCDRIRATEEDRGAVVFPFTHVGGMVWLFASLMYGVTNILDAAFDPESTPQLLARHGVTLAGSGTVFHQAYLAAQRKQPDRPLFPQVRCFPGGGAPKPPRLHHDLRRELGGVGIVSGWGLTEAPILTYASVDDPDEILANTEGRPTEGVELRVVDVESGKSLAPGQVGELRARGPQLMKGYVDASLDADAFDDEGFFRTGDVGKVDEQGNVTITGRVKDVIIRKGENISAADVENHLMQDIRLADVAVVGLPDEERGEMVCAVIVLAEGTDAYALADAREHLESLGVARRKWPERIERVDALPRNPSGKVRKVDLRERFQP